MLQGNDVKENNICLSVCLFFFLHVIAGKKQRSKAKLGFTTYHWACASKTINV
jgi:hypothetical protein